jgi:hypothetical protein
MGTHGFELCDWANAEASEEATSRTEVPFSTEDKPGELHPELVLIGRVGSLTWLRRTSYRSCKARLGDVKLVLMSSALRSFICQPRKAVRHSRGTSRSSSVSFRDGLESSRRHGSRSCHLPRIPHLVNLTRYVLTYHCLPSAMSSRLFHEPGVMSESSAGPFHTPVVWPSSPGGLYLLRFG